MVSFDVKSLFTNISEEYATDLLLKRIYENHEILASITKNELSKILLLCTCYIWRCWLFTNRWDRYGFSTWASIG